MATRGTCTPDSRALRKSATSVDGDAESIRHAGKIWTDNEGRLDRRGSANELARLWKYVVHQFPACIKYQRTTRREISLLLLCPATV